MNFHDALDKLNGPHRKDDVRKLVDTFIAVGRDHQSRLITATVDGETRYFRVAKKLSQGRVYGAGKGDVVEGSEVRVTMIPKQRQHLAYD